NRSTGKMGYAIAEAAHKMGADVTLISGPTNLPAPPKVRVIPVESAAEMYTQVMSFYKQNDIVIKSAAVADYQPKQVFDGKMKKKSGDLVLELKRTTDILKTLGEQKEHQFLVGFAAETDNLDEYAKKKLTSKNLDMIVANNVTTQGAGFGTDTNLVTIYKKDGTHKELPMMTKLEVAKALLREVKRTMDGETK
ncbi:bifunctional phosphopantothenoylcysteine decarboxylase/phosphopantothenate--cysteine ligase CoaBC, partial [Bacillus sp. JJ1521]|uniref:bifunctional phosphopantothenoylcysteine decarboxylase/phosphopantothenate--cysteine ligase CoaBC n=1 Tax=Bacillus sp. JJ1521 TaxID=3122957 RepID=UPI002FFF748B